MNVNPSHYTPQKQPYRRRVPISRLFPNFITLLGMCAGLTAIRFALLGRWEMAAAAILVAGLLDAMDGRLARLLKATSTFGAQLDSLADNVSFGVAPALVLYLWSTHNIRGVGWAVALLFAVCCAIRLARFNTRLSTANEQPPKPWEGRFFTGIPAPAGAGLCLFFMVLSFEFDSAWLRDPLLNSIYLLVIAGLMASRLPTYSLKRIVIHHDLVLPVMLGAALTIVLMIIEPWKTLAFIGVVYVTSIGFSVAHYRRLSKADSVEEEPLLPEDEGELL